MKGIPLILAAVLFAACAVYAQDNGGADQPQQEPEDPGQAAAAALDRAPDSHPVHWAIAAYLSGSVADAATTYHLLSAHPGQFAEGNPTMESLTDHPAGLVVMKAGLAAATTYLLIRYHKEHPRMTFWIGIGGGALYWSFAARNWRMNP